MRKKLPCISAQFPSPFRVVSLWCAYPTSCSQGSKVWASKCGTILQFLLQHTVPPPWTWKPLPDWQSAGRKQRTWEMWTVMARKKAAASLQYLRYTWRWNLHAYPFIHRISRNFKRTNVGVPRCIAWAGAGRHGSQVILLQLRHFCPEGSTLFEASMTCSQSNE